MVPLKITIDITTLEKIFKYTLVCISVTWVFKNTYHIRSRKRPQDLQFVVVVVLSQKAEKGSKRFSFLINIP